MVKKPELSTSRYKDDSSSEDDPDYKHDDTFVRNLRPRRDDRRDSGDSYRGSRRANWSKVPTIDSDPSDESDTDSEGDDEESENNRSGEETVGDTGEDVPNRQGNQVEGGERRSTRQRRQASSWMFASCDDNTRSSPRRRASFQESESSSNIETARRSHRLRRGTREVTEDKQELELSHANDDTFCNENEGESREGENAQAEDDKTEELAEPATGDMYSRLKSRRKHHVDYRDFIRSTRSGRQTKEEEQQQPVSKRLRQRKSKQEEARPNAVEEFFAKAERRRRRRRRKRRHSSSSSSSCSSGSSRGEHRGSRPHQTSFDKAEKAGSKKGFLDLQPNEVDSSITFASVGGLDSVVDKLRETVILPLVYKEFYSARNITPPKGILFHGPPGTGKTLLARALVNECSTLGGQKVTFFVRKGGDLLSKWVGESERQLRKLFEQASRCQPSIVFFDEIDGLAPVRSSKTDQVHNSVVSTLLAELDGIKNRGDVIIIGATNRIDSIDPALRRPGRFDHEFAFLLPAVEGRKQIIKSHTSTWKGEEVPAEVVDEVASRTVGFSGADIKLLCAEASVCAMRRRYPQIYSSTTKYLLDYESIKVNAFDWIQAMQKIKPSSTRVVNNIITTGHPLPKAVVSLLAAEVGQIEGNITNLFPLTETTSLMAEPAPKRFLIYSQHEDSGLDQYILPSVLHRFESVPVFTLNFESAVFRDSASEIAAISRVFNEAERINKLAIVLIASANVLFEGMSSQGHDFLYYRILTASSKPIFVLATAEVSKVKQQLSSSVDKEENTDSCDLPDSLLSLFLGRCHTINPMTRTARLAFFHDVLSDKALFVKAKIDGEDKALEELPLAPPPPPKVPSPEELKKIEKKEMRMLRSLRKFLREVIHKLGRNKKFNDFLRPVDPTVVPDYLSIIKNPMDLETMMIKLNQGLYLSAKDFMQDIHLIRDNAVEYNPPDGFDGQAIIHHSHELVDHAYMVIEDEMDSDFEGACQSIALARKERETLTTGKPTDAPSSSSLSSIPEVPKAVAPKESSTPKPICNGTAESDSEMSGNGKRKLRHAVINGTKLRRVSPGERSASSEGSTCTPISRQNGCGASPIARGSSPQGFSEDGFDYSKCVNYEDCEKQLKKLRIYAADCTDGIGVNRILELRYQLLLVIERNELCMAKSRMLDQLMTVFDSYVKSRVSAL